MRKNRKWGLLVPLVLTVLIVIISASACSNMSTISSFPVIVYAPMGNKTVWAYTEIKQAPSQNIEFPIEPTSIFISNGRYLSTNNAKLLIQLPLYHKPTSIHFKNKIPEPKLSLEQYSKEIIPNQELVTVMKLNTTNDWVVIEENLQAKNQNQGNVDLIAVNIKTKQQRKIGGGSMEGGMQFDYTVKNGYVLWITEALSVYSNISIMNLDTGKTENLNNLHHLSISNVDIFKGYILVNGKKISLTI
ncbi:hypothetical protein [Desulfotomaculum copahuensis]|nr:hypothetical protein [Desulfotomaculum copahuensis]